MLSVIICSANPVDLRLVKENIGQTIGVPYEIISFDNGNAKKGICELYNEGARLAQYDMLCFMHEDISIRTYDWGMRVLEIFETDPEIGILGVAGGGYKSLAPSGWYQVEFISEQRYYQSLLQGYKLDDKDEIHAYHNPNNEKLSRVVCVDGLWICTRKNIALENPFDAKLLKGFHGYDQDFCLSVYPKHKIMVTYDILMKHASEGNFNQSWLDEILKLHRKWNKMLPLSTSNVSEEEFYMTERRCFEKIIEQMLRWDYSFYSIHRMLVQSRKSWIRKKLFTKSYKYFLKLKFGLIPVPDPD